jgi:hypothetical protein
MLVARASTASKIDFGTPPASSMITKTSGRGCLRMLPGRSQQLAGIGDRLVADVPLGIESDAARETGFLARVAQATLPSVSGTVGVAEPHVVGHDFLAGLDRQVTCGAVRPEVIFSQTTKRRRVLSRLFCSTLNQRSRW